MKLVHFGYAAFTWRWVESLGWSFLDAIVCNDKINRCKLLQTQKNKNLCKYSLFLLSGSEVVENNNDRFFCG